MMEVYERMDESSLHVFLIIHEVSGQRYKVKTAYANFYPKHRVTADTAACNGKDVLNGAREPTAFGFECFLRKKHHPAVTNSGKEVRSSGNKVCSHSVEQTSKINLHFFIRLPLS